MSTDKNTAKSPAPIQQYAAPEGMVDVDIDLPAFKAELFAFRREGTTIEDYKGKPVLGKIVECRNFGDAKDPKTGEPIVDEQTGEVRQSIALIFELEAPLDVQGRDKSQPAYEAPVGTKVLVFPTTKILQAILAVAGPRGAAAVATAHMSMGAKVEMICNHPTQMLRVWILPTTRTQHPTDNNKRIWNYKVKVDPKLYTRTGTAALGTKLWDGQFTASAAPAALLPNGRPEHVLPAQS